MAITLVYSDNYEINEIVPDLIVETGMGNDPMLNEHFPISNTDKAKVIWEIQDNVSGLTQVRGVDGQPGRVKNTGFKTNEAEPGYYADQITITEKEMLQQRKPGTPNDVWDITELIAKKTRQLLQRGFWRIRQTVWTLVATGAFANVSPDGVVTHTDTFPVQKINAAVSWGSYTTAAPYSDYGSVQLLHAGHSCVFDGSTYSYMNQATFNKLLKNQNAADLYGFKGNYGSTVVAEGRVGINRVLQNNDRPQIIVFDETYQDDTGTAQRYMPNDIVVFIGKRPGNQPAGKTVFTPNATMLAVNDNDGGGLMDSEFKGIAIKIVDHTPFMTAGAKVDIGVSFNFCPTVEYLSSVVILNVA